MCFELGTGHRRIAKLLVFPSSNLKCGTQDVSVCTWGAVYMCSALQFMAPVRGVLARGRLGWLLPARGLLAPRGGLGCARRSAAAAPWARSAPSPVHTEHLL